MNQNPNHKKDAFDVALTLLKGIFEPMLEAVRGMVTGSMPRGHLFIAGFILQGLIALKVDNKMFVRYGLESHFPRGLSYIPYYLCIVLSPFWLWGLGRTLEKMRLTRRLEEVFKACGLKNNLGNLPRFIFDKPIDQVTRKLRVTAAILPLETFQRAKASLQSGLHVYIDEFKSDLERGTVDIIYAHRPMPEIFRLDNISKIPPLHFAVGTTRSKPVLASLEDEPHLMVAGLTGGGKSTFLRQLITTFYLNDKTCTFLLIDLKGGLEFQLFEKLPRITVMGDAKGASFELTEVSDLIAARMKILKDHHCKDVAAYQKLVTESRKPASTGKILSSMRRHFIVVDEAAEMFLTGSHASPQESTSARRILSQVARQGRSLGIHLVVATQRPDSRAIDPQIKANLPGVLCFQMVNDASSISVLGTGRATDLPSIPGRAIWKTGKDTIEVQTPFLDAENVEGLLKKFRTEPEKPPANLLSPISADSNTEVVTQTRRNPRRNEERKNP
jgi:hypothetical protein